MLFNKKIPKEIIRRLSKERSRQLYLTGMELPPPISQSAPANDTGQRDIPLESKPSPDHKSEANESNRVSNFGGPEVAPGNDVASLPDDLLRFLHLWLSMSSQFISQTALFQLAGISSGSKQKKWKQILLTNGIIIEHVLQKGKGKIVFWEPTMKAWEITGLSKPLQNSKGGFLHQGFANLIAKNAGEKGYRVEIESFMPNGKAIDIVLRRVEEEIWIELGMSTMEREVSGLLDDLASGMLPTKIILACKDGKMKVNLLELIAGEPQLAPFQDKLQILLAADVMDFI